ncbi:hypothetical protein, partial [Staphylococcus aureus]|uniref:hypothetical protein n=1 Tax=Staphylococcus aureus TaxID=1280 RepID=UPI0039BE0108
LFERAHPMLAFLSHAGTELYRYSGPVMRSTALGTDLLSKLGQMLPLRLHTQVACISPLLLVAAYDGDHPEWLRAHARQYGHRFCAANLCRSLLTAPSTRHRPRDLDTGQLQTLVEQLLATRGSALFGENMNG